jgi:hypothetical protein
MANDAVKKRNAQSETSGLVELDFIFGMPPTDMIPETNQIIKNSMPIAKIYPGVPSFREGMDLFTRLPAFNAPMSSPSNRAAKSSTLYYHPLLQSHGFKITERSHVEVAFLADSFPTDSFTNEYGENFLQKLTDVASEGAASLAQIAGGRSVTEAYTNYATALSQKKGVVGGLGKGALAAGNVVRDLFSALPGGAQGAVHTVDKLMAGGRIDFPMVWKSSGFQPSYTMTVRLYNPYPASPESTKKYIIGPIAALMLLATPLSDDGNTYSWPFIHRIESPGIYDLDPAFISNITIVKGGDQQQIAQNQSLAMVDVRIDFGSLFSSMLASNQDVAKSRPTLKKYLKGMESRKSITDRKGQIERNPKVVESPTVKIPQKIKEKTQDQKSNPFDRAISALSKVTGLVAGLAALQKALAAAKKQLDSCTSGDTTCIVDAQNSINRIKARIKDLT